jgi:hypothetical protein
LIKKLREDLTKSLPQLSSEHLEGILQYQAQRYADLATRIHQLRLNPDWKGKEEYIRFVLLGREDAKKILAHRIVETRKNIQEKAEGYKQRAERLKAQAAIRKLQEKAKAVQAITQEYALRFRADKTLKWGGVVGEIQQKLRRVLDDAVEVQQNVKILEAQLDPAKMTRIVSKKLEPFQRLLKKGGEQTSAACNQGFDPCENSLHWYKKHVHEEALKLQAQIEAELDGKSTELHKTQVKKYKQELGKGIDKLGGEIHAQENAIKKHGTLADIGQIRIDEKKTEERLAAVEAEAKQNAIQAKTAAIDKLRAWVQQSEIEVEKKRQAIQRLQTQIQAQEGEIHRIDGEIQKTEGLLGLVDAKRVYLGFQRALQKSKWMREILMFRKQQGIYTSEAVHLRKAQAQKILKQGKILEQEADLRWKEAGNLLKRKELKQKIAEKKIREAEIREKIGAIRQEQQRLREARLWLRIDALEAALRAVDAGVLPAIRQELLSPGWALQELQQLQHAALERLSLSLAAIFQAFEYSGVPIPKSCKGGYHHRALEKLPPYLQSCFQALRQNLAFQSIPLSCTPLTIEQGKRFSLVADASKALQALFSQKEGEGAITFLLEPWRFPQAQRLSLLRADVWVDLVRIGKHDDELPEQVNAQVLLEQPSLGSSQSPKAPLEIHLRQIRSEKDRFDSTGRRCQDAMNAEAQNAQRKLMYFNPLMRWTLRLEMTQLQRNLLQDFRPVRMRINFVYRQPNLAGH